jgi:hypothetical protein
MAASNNKYIYYDLPYVSCKAAARPLALSSRVNIQVQYSMHTTSSTGLLLTEQANDSMGGIIRNVLTAESARARAGSAEKVHKSIIIDTTSPTVAMHTAYTGYHFHLSLTSAAVLFSSWPRDQHRKVLIAHYTQGDPRPPGEISDQSPIVITVVSCRHREVKARRGSCPEMR